jgi:hypothetical protein
MQRQVNGACGVFQRLRTCRRGSGAEVVVTRHRMPYRATVRSKAISTRRATVSTMCRAAGRMGRPGSMSLRVSGGSAARLRQKQLGGERRETDQRNCLLDWRSPYTKLTYRASNLPDPDREIWFRRVVIALFDESQKGPDSTRSYLLSKTYFG